MLYAGEIWAVDFVREVESIQSKFFKRLLHLPIYTPNYILRLETGRLPIIYNILKSALDWWGKLLEMPENRLPRMCYGVLTELNRSEIDSNYWVKTVENTLLEIEEYEIWLAQDPLLLKTRMKTITIKLCDAMLAEDLSRAENSSYSLLYKEILNIEPEAYYLFKTNKIKKIRIIAQLRLANQHITTLFIDGHKISFSDSDICSYCNSNEPDDIEHALFRCPILNSLRNTYINEHMFQNQSLSALLTNLNNCKINAIFFFIIELIKIRNFVN